MSKKKRLEEIDLNITNRCNIGCKHCLFAAGPDREDNLPLNLIKNILTDGKKLGAQEVHISGGEPTVRDDFLNILKMAYDFGYFVRLQTNLWRFRSKMIARVKSYTNEVLTSVDGLESSHDQIRRKGSFQKTMNCIKELLSNDIRVVVITAVQRKNYQDISSLIDLLVDTGVNAHFLFSITPLGRASKKDIVSPEEWEQLIAILHKKYKGQKMNTDVVCELHHLNGNEAINYRGAECRLYTKNHAVVLPTGDVFPCSLFITTDKSLGNVNKQTFETIWAQSPVWSFYSSKINDTKCIKCKLWNLCKGGCPGYSYLFTGNIEKKDPRCEPNRYPVCPSWKLNIQDSTLSCSTWKVMKR